MDTWLRLEKSGLQKEIKILKMMEDKIELQERSKSTLAEESQTKEVKYLDGEINRMKQIREAYFLPKEHELKQLDEY